jgi:hypothetical protein
MDARKVLLLRHAHRRLPPDADLRVESVVDT